MKITLSAHALARALGFAALALVIAGVAAELAFHHLPEVWSTHHFRLRGEGNVPTWFATVLLLLGAVLFGSVAALARSEGDRWWRHWAGLALLLLVFSIDEAAALHDSATGFIRARLDAGGVFYYAWVIPAMAILLVLGIVYARFALALPTRTRRLLALAAGIYFGGALGLELVQGAYQDAHGQDWFRSALSILEEICEFTGAIVLVYALADCLSRRFGGVELRVETAGGR